jgi:hypothetical protein
MTPNLELISFSANLNFYYGIRGQVELTYKKNN